MNHYLEMTKAMRVLDQAPGKEFISRVVKAADRWRALDPESTMACQLAAQVLQAVGGKDATELAWEYLTTPIAQKPNEAKPWLDLANTLRKDERVDLADRAFATAFQAEPTNAQILWERAQYLQQQGRSDQARALYRQIADGDWQPRFQPLRNQAR